MSNMKNELIKRMNEDKAFIEKYPEFEEKVFHTEEIPKDRDDAHIQRVDVEEILDKHFIRKKEVGNPKSGFIYYSESCPLIEKQKVKDAIDKVSRNIPARFNDYYSAETVLKELLKELDLK